MIPLYQGDVAWKKLNEKTEGGLSHDPKLVAAVETIIAKVKTGQDAALKELAASFGDSVPESLQLSSAEIEAAIQRVPAQTRHILDEAASNIRTFAEAVIQHIQPFSLERHGYIIGMDFKPVERVACYVPGGRYPLPSTAIMTAVTAQVAGVPEICMTSPVFKDEVIYAGSLAGVKTFYQLGGAQAIAALAFGTESIAPVDMVVGPGNAYVTEAKRQLQGLIGIDILAGPSEVAIIADEGTNPEWTALDMLSQAEHDIDARAYLLTDSLTVAEAVQQQIDRFKIELALPEFVCQAIDTSAIFVFEDRQACIKAANLLAPEHLELHVSEPDQVKSELTHYGALFMGYAAAVPFGDYMAGPNHTLPTARTARFSGGLSPLTFLRPQSWMQPEEGLAYLSDFTTKFADLEGLTVHAASAKSRSLLGLLQNSEMKI